MNMISRNSTFIVDFTKHRGHQRWAPLSGR
jgi:hypothetical protein